MDQLTVRRYQEGDETHILKLFRSAFSREMASEFWRWRFRDNPAGRGAVMLAWDGPLLVGHYAAIPVELIVGARRIPGLLSMTTMTHPDYGGRGIFTALADRLYHEAASEGFEVVFGFPNSNSRHGFVKKLGWHDAGLVTALSGIVPGQIQADPTFSVQETAGLPGDLPILLAGSPQPPAGIYRTPAYISWRYLEHPDEPYTLLDARAGGRICGLAVLKTYRGEDADVGHVVDLIADSPDAAAALIDAALGWFRANGTQRTASWFPPGSWAERRLLEHGLERVGTETSFGYRALSDPPIEALDNWWITMGDSDVY